MQHLFTREHAKLAIRIERKKEREKERIFVLICIKSIPFWRQFEDWNTNFELSTWDTSSQNGSSDGSGGKGQQLLA